jgi:hypothetical protein
MVTAGSSKAVERIDADLTAAVIQRYQVQHPTLKLRLRMTVQRVKVRHLILDCAAGWLLTSSSAGKFVPRISCCLAKRFLTRPVFAVKVCEWLHTSADLNKTHNMCYSV